MNKQEQFSFNFLRELDKLNSQTSTHHLPRKQRKRKKESNWNQTQKWFFDPTHNSFEQIRDYLIKTARQDVSTGDLSDQDYEDYFMGWVTDVCKRDTLSAKLVEGEKIQTSVLYWWYRQYIQRASMKNGQDALSRVYGCRTQSEITHNKETLHDIEKMENAGFQVASVSYNLDAEGKTKGEDYYYENESPSSLEVFYINQCVKDILSKSYSDLDTLNQRYRLYEEMVEGKGGHQSLEEWAEDWGISVAQLKHRVSHIEKLLKKNKELFGY